MKISVLGMGAYGIALAKVFYKNDNDVIIWTKFKEELDNISLTRENKSYLPGVKIPRQVELTDNLDRAINGVDIIVVAIPMNALREVLSLLKDKIDKKQVICLVTKGIEQKTGDVAINIAQQELDTKNICMLSGPSIAKELAEENTAGLVIASSSNFAALSVKICLENENLDVVQTDDIIGVQYASAIKNVFAIFCGIMDVKGYSDSSRAAILTRLIMDFKELIVYFGGKEETLLSYAGIGDMLLTCMSDKSRNYNFGKLVGSGMNWKDAMKKIETSSVEGVSTLNEIHELLNKDTKIKVKSINVLHEIVFKGKKVDNLLKCL